jgi:hypothetical protein
VISWNQVSNVRIKASNLQFSLPEGRMWKKYYLPIQDKEGLIDYVEDMCKSRGIPFERVAASRGNEPGDRKEDVDGEGI